MGGTEIENDVETETRARSDASSRGMYRSKHKMKFRLSIDDVWMPSSNIVNDSEFKFVHCQASGCSVSSAFLQYNAMTLRAGFNTCTAHTTLDITKTKIDNSFIFKNTVFIFYDP
ncbi:hypothetical protein B0A48_18400 [Cryoendolithus antarcticus]|uniref:Uncharacterized protein n=1 Tax=Cryoendolithus antarcticus TaxID=1507870 RepID=A0A1V8S8T4_9PEZI|nr:hypothetical protein B0A48_18400 [Cryoendolithus antarcticus]